MRNQAGVPHHTTSDACTRWRCLEGLRDEAIAIVRTRISRPDDAEDHVHDAMLRLVRRESLELDPARVRALLVRAAAGIAIDRYRQEVRHSRIAPRLGDPRDVCADSPEDVAADRDEARWLAQGLPKLAEMERAALLHAMDGLAPGEIAELLGVGYKAAENALGRARRKLRLRAAAVATSIGVLLRRVLSQEHTGAVLSGTALTVFLVVPCLGSAPVRADTPSGLRARTTTAIVMAPVLEPPHSSALPAGTSRVASQPVQRSVAAPSVAPSITRSPIGGELPPGGLPPAPSRQPTYPILFLPREMPVIEACVSDVAADAQAARAPGSSCG